MLMKKKEREREKNQQQHTNMILRRDHCPSIVVLVGVNLLGQRLEEGMGMDLLLLVLVQEDRDLERTGSKLVVGDRIGIRDGRRGVERAKRTGEGGEAKIRSGSQPRKQHC